jgi:hypothetical protein
MKSIRSTKRASVVLGMTVLGAIAATSSHDAMAARFPYHALFWMSKTSPLYGDDGIPNANFSFCKSANTTEACTIHTERMYGSLPNLYYFYTPLLEVPYFPSESVAFATPYGEGNTYCASTGANGYLGASCSRATKLSVRAVSNGHFGGLNKDSLGWENGGWGAAAYGIWGYSTNGASVPSDYDISFNSTRTVNRVLKTGRGSYTITMPGLGRYETTANGVAHVQAVVSEDGIGLGVKRICTIDSVNVAAGPASADVEMSVRCFGKDNTNADQGYKHLGAFDAKDTAFAYIYEMPDEASLVRAVFSNDATASTNGYTPEHRSNIAIKVFGIGLPGQTGEIGRYRVNLPSTSASGTNVQVTAKGYSGTAPNYCNVEKWTPDGFGGTDVFVNCFRMTADGPVPINSRFYLGYYGRR